MIPADFMQASGKGRLVSVLSSNRSSCLSMLVCSFVMLSSSVLPLAASASDPARFVVDVAEYRAPEGRSQCRGAAGYSNGPVGHRTFLWRPEYLAVEKARILSEPDYAKPLRDAAEMAMKRGPYSVTEKLKTPASGDRHDYYSIGPYWWPTPGAAGGLPYVRRDGDVNPESRGNEFDKDRLFKFSNDVRVLTLAYHYFGERRYADHAAKLLRVWFIAPETRMNPNLNHGQAVPGISDGRAEGIIELNAMSPVVESIGLLAPTGVMTDAELSSLENWFGRLVDWMANSPIGKAENAKSNNHGIYYDYLVAHFALFARREGVAQNIVVAFPDARMGPQIAADGSLPEELSRTRSWHYSYFALEGATKLATVGECVGLDLWSAQTTDRKSLAKAFGYLARYQGDIDKWPYKDSGLADPEKREDTIRSALEPLRLMAWGSGDARYEKQIPAYSADKHQSNEYWLPPMPDIAAFKRQEME
jgi:hypothetical protein